jgi:hypothetical protein
MYLQSCSNLKIITIYLAIHDLPLVHLDNVDYGLGLLHRLRLENVKHILLDGVTLVLADFLKDVHLLLYNESPTCKVS